MRSGTPLPTGTRRCAEALSSFHDAKTVSCVHAVIANRDTPRSGHGQPSSQVKRCADVDVGRVNPPARTSRGPAGTDHRPARTAAPLAAGLTGRGETRPALLAARSGPLWRERRRLGCAVLTSLARPRRARDGAKLQHSFGSLPLGMGRRRAVGAAGKAGDPLVGHGRSSGLLNVLRVGLIQALQRCAGGRISLRAAWPGFGPAAPDLLVRNLADTPVP